MAARKRQARSRRRRKPSRAMRAEEQTPLLPYGNSWGGYREGAGRKQRKDSGVSHLQRDKLAARHPVHVTLRLQKGLPTLRKKRPYRAILRCFAAGCERNGFRLVHYSVQSNHLHLMVEAKDRTALSRGMQGLCIRIAKALNRLWERKGSVFADRYHDRILRSPREVRNALRYVLNNAMRHGIMEIGDMFSSARWFDGWSGMRKGVVSDLTRPLALARTWLLTTGWRKGGLLDPCLAPRW